MGVFSRKNKKGVTWYLRYTHNGEQVIEKVGRSTDGVIKKMAENALTSRRGDIIQGRFNIAQTKKYPRFDKALEKYLVYSETHKKAHERDLTSSKHLKPFLGKKRLDEITSFMIEQYKKMRKDEIKGMRKSAGKDERDISFVSINRELSMLKHLFSMSIKWGDIDRNPVSGIKMFPAKSRDRYLSEDEIGALLDACGKSKNRHLTAIVLTALNTGGRRSEILNLRVRDIDFENSLIYFEHTKNGDKGNVPMNDCLRAVLMEHLKGHKHEYVFCNYDGTPFKEVREAFNTACSLAGIKNFRFHDLRRTFASHLAMNGVEGRTLQSLGRWKTLDMVKTYAHLSESHKKKAVNTLNGLFGGKNDEIMFGTV